MNWGLLGSAALNLERLALTLKLSLFDSKLGLLEYQQLPFGCLLGSSPQCLRPMHILLAGIG